MFQESFEIHIHEPAVAPRLYLETDSSLDAPITPASHDTFTALYSGRAALGFEGNTTLKDIGVVHLCDVNVNDALELMSLNVDGNVTYTIAEVTGKVPVSEDEDDDMVFMCLQTNIR